MASNPSMSDVEDVNERPTPRFGVLHIMWLMASLAAILLRVRKLRWRILFGVLVFSAVVRASLYSVTEINMRYSRWISVTSRVLLAAASGVFWNFAFRML